MKKPTKCSQCGSRVKAVRENYRHPALGLSSLTLIGVEIFRCPSCGETEVTIPNLEGLMAAIASVLVQKHQRLTPEEVRFLRKYLGWSGSDFAAHMGVTPEAVSRWENGKAAMGPVADRLLRVLVANIKPVDDYSVDALTEIVDEASPSQVRLKPTKQHEWKNAA